MSEFSTVIMDHRVVSRSTWKGTVHVRSVWVRCVSGVTYWLSVLKQQINPGAELQLKLCVSIENQLRAFFALFLLDCHVNEFRCFTIWKRAKMFTLPVSFPQFHATTDGGGNSQCLWIAFLVIAFHNIKQHFLNISQRRQIACWE